MCVHPVNTAVASPILLCMPSVNLGYFLSCLRRRGLAGVLVQLFLVNLVCPPHFFCSPPRCTCVAKSDRGCFRKRYMKQNEQALEEAKTALETREISTPSAISLWSSDGLETESKELDPCHRGRSRDECSSGEEYQPWRTNCKSDNSPLGSEEDIVTDC
ncbi:hypothetical protein M758_UG340400 [Ceratodon purpureus]|nr:hypothetical protein M758_UG340400 [Ceratodon purpureus]